MPTVSPGDVAALVPAFLNGVERAGRCERGALWHACSALGRLGRLGALAALAALEEAGGTSSALGRLGRLGTNGFGGLGATLEEASISLADAHKEGKNEEKSLGHHFFQSRCKGCKDIPVSDREETSGWREIGRREIVR